ncbi:hypothetical protein HHK36_025854 [Tetracentron sinense]|uniref:Uncharacterized protein n=1 Tax=Tetracentron sinense TaxID=13715 RepID=A0A835D3X8_TETSI|nr:hypothetical protein HHK36_025854 [Tetracentron sinense]
MAEMVMLSTNEENPKLAKKAGGYTTKNRTPECKEKFEVKRGEVGMSSDSSLGYWRFGLRNTENGRLCRCRSEPNRCALL